MPKTKTKTTKAPDVLHDAEIARRDLVSLKREEAHASTAVERAEATLSACSERVATAEKAYEAKRKAAIASLPDASRV